LRTLYILKYINILNITKVIIKVGFETAL